MRRIAHITAVSAAALLLACAHHRTAEQEAMLKRADCAELLRAADAARAQGDPVTSADLAAACPSDKLAALVDQAPTAAQALLWCGRASAAQQKGCDPARVSELVAKLNPHLTIGPSDDSTPLDPLLGSALDEIGKDLNLAWEAHDPDVVIGKLTATVEHATNSTTALVADAKGKKVRVPATLHRFVARAEAQVVLGSKTRTVRAQEEARDLTWEAAPKLAVAAKFEPSVPPEAEMKKRAALAWLRTLSRALAANPPEGVDVSDEKGCVAYGLSLNLSSGDPLAAANGAGEPDKISACEKLLGEPPGAGVPVP
jgi:antitoxin component HigA of HigAB toxin-antitoxin module